MTINKRVRTVVIAWHSRIIFQLIILLPFHLIINILYCFLLQVIADSLTKACKCHGVSGSCSVKTCWRAMPNFDAIGDNLKRHYSYSIEVRTRRINKVKQFVPILPTIATISEDSLIYYSKSPDYCSPDVKTGSIGTQDRWVLFTTRGGGGEGACLVSTPNC